MSLTLYNTLTKQKEIFTPLSDKYVRMYHCGPTVYDRQHIGNLRSAVIWDILRRVLEWNGYQVTQVINITDFGHLTSDADEGEDKMAKGLKREGLPISLASMALLAQKYTESYLNDREALNTLPPSHLPIASKHLAEYISLIKKLEEKGFAYKLSDGIYFDTKKDSNYGKLAPHQTEESLSERTTTTSEKKSPRDFALWKFNPELGFESPWGQGFPGWHIECSGMSLKYLGETFDIHTGGIEHIPIHHTNEIAQSENATGKPMARFWLHNNHLLMPEGKMSKSLGNVYNLDDTSRLGVEPLALRYLFLQAHYRAEQQFSEEALLASQVALTRLRETISRLEDKDTEPDKSYLAQFTNLINDDLDTASGLALLHKLLKDDSVDAAVRRITALSFDEVFGLKLDRVPNSHEIPEQIVQLARERNRARLKKDWERADKLRSKIEEAGYEVSDTDKSEQGFIIRKLD